MIVQSVNVQSVIGQSVIVQSVIVMSVIVKPVLVKPVNLSNVLRQLFEHRVLPQGHESVFLINGTEIRNKIDIISATRDVLAQI